MARPSASAISALCHRVTARSCHPPSPGDPGQPGYHFTDLSPSGNVVELNRRLGFHSLDTSTAPQINWPALRKSSVGLINDEIEIERRLSRSRPADLFAITVIRRLPNTSSSPAERTCVT